MIEEMMENCLSCHPIGYFRGNQSEKYMAPRQAELGIDKQTGYILLNSGCNFEQALEDLEGFERIWILYWFNRNNTWKTKVTTPRQGPKRGVFATRSPHRPNPLGLSCVQLLDIKGKKISIGKHDLLDGTPILDIKPYLAYADAFPNCKQGWIENSIQIGYEIEWSPLALKQAHFIEENEKIPVIDSVVMRLQDNPFPFKNHRIKQIEENLYELGYKTWRLHYTIKNKAITLHKILSNYCKEILDGKKPSRWKDVATHQKFVALFYTEDIAFISN